MINFIIMNLLNLLLVGIHCCLLIRGQFVAIPTPPSGSFDATVPAKNKTIIYTFSSPNLIQSTTPAIIMINGDCGFCADDTGCYCYDGCYFDSKLNQCRDRNECLFLPCINGGTCINEMGNYFCLCPDGYAGRDCEIRTNQPLGPIVLGISRNRGIIAGGGEVEITGMNFDFYPPVVVRFIQRYNRNLVLQGGIQKSTFKTSEKFIITIPRADRELIGLPFMVEIMFAKRVVLKILGNFTYTDNPTITEIRPINPLVTTQGGAELIIIGTNLDVPTKNEISAIVKVFNKTTAELIFQGSNSSSCVAVNSTVAYCEMPNYGISKNNTWMAQSDEVNGTITANLTHDKFYNRAPLVKPSFRQPKIKANSELLYYEPERKESLKIEAEGVDTASTSLVDYEVQIGSDTCTMTSMSTNKLECMPPSKTPLAAKNSVSMCNSDGLAVFVKVHSDPQFARCVLYYDGRRPVIIGLSITAAIVVAAALAAVFVFRKRIRCPNRSRVGDLVNPRRAFGTLSSGVVNPRFSTIYANVLPGLKVGDPEKDDDGLVKGGGEAETDADDSSVEKRGTPPITYLTPEGYSREIP